MEPQDTDNSNMKKNESDCEMLKKASTLLDGMHLNIIGFLVLPHLLTEDVKQKNPELYYGQLTKFKDTLERFEKAIGEAKTKLAKIH